MHKLIAIWLLIILDFLCPVKFRTTFIYLICHLNTGHSFNTCTFFMWWIFLCNHSNTRHCVNTCAVSKGIFLCNHLNIRHGFNYLIPVFWILFGLFFEFFFVYYAVFSFCLINTVVFLPRSTKTVVCSSPVPCVKLFASELKFAC